MNCALVTLWRVDVEAVHVHRVRGPLVVPGKRASREVVPSVATPAGMRASSRLVRGACVGCVAVPIVSGFRLHAYGSWCHM